MAHYVLVHGGQHGAWCWERLIPLLDAAGHRVTAPDLAGMGQDRTPFAPDALAQWADQIAALIEREAEPVILVGHSRGGLVISEVAERVPDRIRRLVYLAAFLLPPGASMMQSLVDYMPGGPPPIIIDEESGTVMLKPGVAEPMFYNLCSPEDAAACVARLSPEPIQTMSQGLRISMERFGQVPRAYIETTHDRAIALEHQRAMQADLPCEKILRIDSDHSPFYSAPLQLRDALLALA